MAAYAFGLVGLLTAAPWARRSVARTRGLGAPALLFSLSLVMGVIAMTPTTSSMASSVWRLVAVRPSASVDHSATLVEIIKLCGLSCVFMLGLVVGGEDRRAKRFFRVFVIAAALYCVWAFLQYIIAPETVLGLRKSYHQDRLTASFLSANTAGSLFGMIFVLAFAPIVDGLTREAVNGAVGVERLMARELLSLLALVGSACCLVLTASRGAAAATIVAALLMAATRMLTHGGGRRTWTAMIAFALLAAGLGLMLLDGSSLTVRLVQSSGDFARRNTLYAVHWAAFTRSAWLGTGLGSFDVINQLSLNPANFLALWDIRAAHDVYLQWLEQAGLLGAIPMFCAIAVVLQVIARAAWRGGGSTSWLLGVTGASVVLLLHGMSDFALEVPAISSLWTCMLGVGFATAKRRSSPGETIFRAGFRPQAPRG